MKALMVAVALAALTATATPTVANAEGICVCGMKRPLRTDGLHHLKKPLTQIHIDASNIWHRPL